MARKYVYGLLKHLISLVFLATRNWIDRHSSSFPATLLANGANTLSLLCFIPSILCVTEPLSTNALPPPVL